MECSSFPFFTPKILVIKVLKSRVEEFLTWKSKKNKKPNQFHFCEKDKKTSGVIGGRCELTAQTAEVNPSTAACIPSETKGMMFSPRRVSLKRALRMLRAWTCGEERG